MRVFILALAVLPCFAAAAPADYEWRPFPDDPSQIALWNDGVQVGNLHLEDAKFYKRLGPGSWEGPVACPAGIPAAYLKVCKRQPSGNSCSCECCGENCTCPTGKHCNKPNCPCVLPSPLAGVVEKDGVQNFGVDTKEISKEEAQGRHFLNGKEVSRTQLIEALKATVSVPDDANLLAITVIGPETSRQQVLGDLSSSEVLRPFKGQYRLQSYAPEHWAVKDVGFYTGGSPTIYVQAPSGKVLHRQDDYHGPADLAKVLTRVAGELRAKDANYDPSRDPDLHKDFASKLTDWLQSLPPYAWIIAGVLVLFFLLRNPSSSS